MQRGREGGGVRAEEEGLNVRKRRNMRNLNDVGSRMLPLVLLKQLHGEIGRR